MNINFPDVFVHFYQSIILFIILFYYLILLLCLDSMCRAMLLGHSEVSIQINKSVNGFWAYKQVFFSGWTNVSKQISKEEQKRYSFIDSFILAVMCYIIYLSQKQNVYIFLMSS